MFEWAYAKTYIYILNFISGDGNTPFPYNNQNGIYRNGDTKSLSKCLLIYYHKIIY